LEAELLKLVKDKDYDAALRRAVTFFQERLYAAYGDRFVNPRFDWMGLGSILLGVVGAWLALSFMHGFTEGVFRAGSAGLNPGGLPAPEGGETSCWGGGTVATCSLASAGCARGWHPPFRRRCRRTRSRPSARGRR